MNASIDIRSLARSCVVCATAQYELIVLDSICLAVRERSTGEWLEDHSAIDERVSLQPMQRSEECLAEFQLVAHSFGLRLLLGRVFGVRAADASIWRYIQEHPNAGPYRSEWLEEQRNAPALKVA